VIVKGVLVGEGRLFVPRFALRHRNVDKNSVRTCGGAQTNLILILTPKAN
jgi:hypothetical protein